MTVGRLLLAAAAGGLLTVDRKAFLQAGLSRPLVACAVVGALLDQLAAGLLVGAPLELFFLGSANLGAAPATAVSRPKRTQAASHRAA